MRFVFLCLAIVLGGCAGRVHWNPTQQGLALEIGVAATESAGDFNVKNADAATRRLYAEACRATKEPAACLRALALGANRDAARRAYYCGDDVCWEGRHRPFARSARGLQLAGATYDVVAVNAVYASMVSDLSSGPDIAPPGMRQPAPPPPAAPEPPATRRSGDRLGATAPRVRSLPNPEGAPPVKPQAASCAEFSAVKDRYLAAVREIEEARERQDVEAARRAFRWADQILVRGLAICQGDEAALGIFRGKRTRLNTLRKELGLQDQEA